MNVEEATRALRAWYIGMARGWDFVGVTDTQRDELLRAYWIGRRNAREWRKRLFALPAFRRVSEAAESVNELIELVNWIVNAERLVDEEVNPRTYVETANRKLAEWERAMEDVQELTSLIPTASQTLRELRSEVWVTHPGGRLSGALNIDNVSRKTPRDVRGAQRGWFVRDLCEILPDKTLNRDAAIAEFLRFIGLEDTYPALVTSIRKKGRT